MTQHLNESHLVKQGMRFWFTNDEVASLDQASEIGGRYQVRLPSYQLDRAVFDEEVLRRACLAGATLLRPASVTKVQLSAGGEQVVTLRAGEVLEEVRQRDRRDRERAVSPLVRARDAVLVDNTAMGAEETARLIVLLAREREAAKAEAQQV